ncbi:MAG: MFS transporter [Candidatus Bathyarchaeia archaeon]
MLCWVGWIVNYLNRMNVPPILPLIMRDFDLNYAQAGLLTTAFLLGYAGMQLPSGFLSDRYGRKIMIVFGMVVYSVGTLLMGIASNIHQITALRFLVGLGEGTHLSVANSLISEYFSGKSRAKAIGIHESGPNVGSTIALPLVVFISVVLGWRWVFYITAIPGLILAALFWKVVKEPARPRSRDRQTAITSVPMKGMTATLVSMAVAYSAYNLCIWVLYNFVPTYLVDVRGMSLVAASFITTLLPASGIFAKIMSGYVSNRVGRKWVICSGLGVTGLSVCILTMTEDPMQLMIVMVCMGLALFSFSPAIYSFVADVSPPHKRGTFLSLVNVTGLLTGAVSPAVVGFIADQAGFNTAFLYISGLSLLSTLPILLWMRSPRGRIDDARSAQLDLTKEG